MPAHDGQEGVVHVGANQSNVPIEMIEATQPLRVEQYALVPDSGGPGKHRGGCAMVRDFRILADEALLTVRSDKRRFLPFGLHGGHPGTPSWNIVNPGRGQRILPVLMTEPVRLGRGDLFRHMLAGGGGYGPPRTRDPALVLEDVRLGKVTPAHARSAYGVVVRRTRGRWRIDAAATAALRAADPGPGRT
jgi:N-methylhydantoinase B